MIDGDLIKNKGRGFFLAVISIVASIFVVCCGLIAEAMPVIWFGSAMFIGGFLWIGYSIVTGIGAGLGSDHKKPEERHERVYIMSKLLLTKKGETVLDIDLHDPDTLQYLIQIHFENGRKSEFRTSPAVFDAIREGQRGTLLIQGKWINQFIFRPELSVQDERGFNSPYRPGS